MDKFTANELLDQYESLLTAKQQQICQLYYREDLSLMEISELMNITRAAVHDTIKRCEKIMGEYEKNLKLCAKSSQR
ncbi:MAG: DNA-binding protein, partial [Erysipelotrichaceae bacterium]|nr:DNA-binding protein [Erysipelotrichaceae bacterium]